MSTYRLITHEIEAMRFDGSIESAEKICEWVNKTYAKLSPVPNKRAVILPVKMRRAEAGQDLILDKIQGITLLIDAPTQYFSKMVDPRDYVVKHGYPEVGFHVRHDSDMLSYELVEAVGLRHE